MTMIGIIGGSGLDDPKLLKDFEEKEMETKFGKPSSAITLGKLNGVQVAILARHGKKHSINPTRVNYRANIWALKELGVKSLITGNAVGSLREEIAPGDLALPSQFIDLTRHRMQTFFDEGKVCHISMAEPFCPELRKILGESAIELNLKMHFDKTVLVFEGPRFSTKAESKLYRNFGADLLSMTLTPEAVLAREAGICYQPVAMSSDYDCFLEGRNPVTLEEVFKTMKANSEKVKKLFLHAIPKIARLESKKCTCEKEIKTALV